MNSAADIKAFCGERGGLVCTSSNARGAFEWAFARGEKILFLPDQHLGRNTAYAMGIPMEQMVVWDPYMINGGVEPARLKGGEGDPCGRDTAACISGFCRSMWTGCGRRSRGCR